jgi:cytochrome c peroxidase
MRKRRYSSALSGAVLASLAFVWINLGAEPAPPNTGMADPVAIMNAFDRFLAGGGGTNVQVIPLTGLRGMTSESFNAGGDVRIDFTNGSVDSQVRGLPLDGVFDLWLIDNRPSSGHTTFADLQDLSTKVGTYGVVTGAHKLAVVLGAGAFGGFNPDRALVVRSGQSPLNGFVLTGSSSIFDRLFRRQVRFAGDPGATPGFDPTASATREVSFARLVAEGRRLFLKEKFEGNGRTCGTCHAESNNFTIDPEFIATLPASDPLFVAEANPALAALENPNLMRTFGLIGVNADGFEKGLVFRATQNVQALANSSLRPDPSFGGDFTGNGRNPDPPERLGWSNDGAPLRDFALVAIAQHATKTLSRIRGLDFRVPTDEEQDALVAYQFSLGRQVDFDLLSLELKSTIANTGKTLYLDTGNLGQPGHKNCNACHFNAGGTGAFSANPSKPGFPRLDGSPHNGNLVTPTNVNETPLALALGLPRDGGFGVLALATGGFGNFGATPARGTFPIEEFNTPPLVESADTGPFFHNHTLKTLEDAVAFYGTAAFQNSPLSISFGLIKIAISSDPNDPEVQAISAFLRVLNALENIRSSVNLVERGRKMTNEEDARDLAALALAETIDAIQVLSEGALAKSQEPGILSARAHLAAARALLDVGPASLAAIGNRLEQAVNRMRAARSELANPATLPPSIRN